MQTLIGLFGDIRTRRRLVVAGLVLLFLPYLGYIALVMSSGAAPIDYQTFMSIGERLRRGEEIYGNNSFYPLPFVMVFAAFSALPYPVSVFLWLALPLVAALFATRHPLAALLYAPLFSHVTGGQSALFGLIALWGYRSRRDPDNAAGGFWLAFALLKPQLSIIPLVFAGWGWARVLLHERRVPRQAWAWLFTGAALYLPSFLIIPDWPLRWLRNSRPLWERPMAAIVPRTLLMLDVAPGSVIFWLLLMLIAGLLLFLIWRLNRRALTFDLLVLWGCTVIPLFHDYDLIQLIPLFDAPLLAWLAAAVSIPGWIVIFFDYGSIRAWYVFSFIPFALLWVKLAQSRRPRRVSTTPAILEKGVVEVQC